MLSRTSIRHQRAVRCLQCAAQKRGLAAPASGSFAYETGDTKGVKYASRDLPQPTTTLAIVSKAGTRFQPGPGVAEGLLKFAFKYTERRSALRITRESELLGAQRFGYVSPESIVLGARFLREDLPYFVELLAEVTSQTKYQTHVFAEEVLPNIKLSEILHWASPEAVAKDAARGVAFHKGLGSPLFPSPNYPLASYLSPEAIQDFAGAAYAKPNFAIVANGADHSEFSKWVGEFFKDYAAPGGGSASPLKSEPTKYFGGETRIAHDKGNALVIAFPGSSSSTGSFYKPEIQVLASLLGGETNIKWSSGFSLLSKASANITGSIDTKSVIFSDAGLLNITISGDAHSVSQLGKTVVGALKDVAAGKIAKDDIKKAIAAAKFKELEFGQTVDNGIELTGAGLIHGGKAYQMDEVAKTLDSVTEEQVKKAAASLLQHKASVAAVGDLYALPWAEELGLKV